MISQHKTWQACSYTICFQSSVTWIKRNATKSWKHLQYTLSEALIKRQSSNKWHVQAAGDVSGVQRDIRYWQSCHSRGFREPLPSLLCDWCLQSVDRSLQIYQNTLNGTIVCITVHIIQTQNVSWIIACLHKRNITKAWLNGLSKRKSMKGTKGTITIIGTTIRLYYCSTEE